MNKLSIQYGDLEGSFIVYYNACDLVIKVVNNGGSAPGGGPAIITSPGKLTPILKIILK